MSQVTNIILTIAHVDTFKFPELAAALHREDISIVAPVRVDRQGALDKMMEVGVYVGGYNYLRLDDLVEAIDGVAWHRPEAVRLFVEEQHDEEGFHEVALPECDKKRRGQP